jgi:hypothetical protein
MHRYLPYVKEFMLHNNLCLKVISHCCITFTGFYRYLFYFQISCSFMKSSVFKSKNVRVQVGILILILVIGYKKEKLFPPFCKRWKIHIFVERSRCRFYKTFYFSSPTLWTKKARVFVLSELF